MPEILLLSGSLRAASHNTALAHALRASAPEDFRCTVAVPADVPLYNGDIEQEEGIPAAVAGLKEQLARADGLILVTPEYNQGVPGVLKNAIDWMSRPPTDVGRVFRGRPVALCGATPGGAGTRTAQYAWLPTLRGLGMQVWAGGTLFVAQSGTAFDATGALVDDDLRARARRYIEDFGRWAERARALTSG